MIQTFVANKILFAATLYANAILVAKKYVSLQMDFRHFPHVESSPSFLFATSYRDDCMCRSSSNFVLGI